MKHMTPILTVFSTMLLMSSVTGAGEAPQSGITFTPDQMTWQPNPRVPGLGVARIISSGKQPGIGSSFRPAVSYKLTAIRMIEPIRFLPVLGTLGGERLSTNLS